MRGKHSWRNYSRCSIDIKYLINNINCQFSLIWTVEMIRWWWQCHVISCCIGGLSSQMSCLSRHDQTWVTMWGGTSSARDHDVDGVISVSVIIRLISGVSTVQLPQLIQIKSVKKVLKCFVTRIVSHVMNVSTIVIIWQKMWQKLERD